MPVTEWYGSIGGAYHVTDCRECPPMLPSASLPMPREWRELLEQLAPVFARRSTHRLFMLLACGLILADRGTVTGMAAAAGTGRRWRRACWFFAAAAVQPARCFR